MSVIQTKTNPIIYIAAVSVIIFSTIGVGVMTGLIPSGFSTTAPSKPAAAAANETAESAAPAEQKTTAAAKPDSSTSTSTSNSTSTSAKTATPARMVSNAKSPSRATPVCANCGVVSSVNAIEQMGEGSGLGAVAGGVLGGVLGNQVGGGTGNKIATIAGVAGGAYAGHQVEKNMKKTLRYDISVRMDDGTSTVISQRTEPSYRVGDKVKVVNGALTPNY